MNVLISVRGKIERECEVCESTGFCFLSLGFFFT